MMKWRTIKIDVDIETGEILTKEKLHNYILINKNKNTDYDKRIIECTNKWSRTTYGLFGDD